MRKVAIVVLSVLGLLVLGVAITIAVLNESKPVGRPGPQADALARRMADWTELDAWKKTGAVRWTFADRFDHLWDKQRDYVRVSWGPYVVTMRLSTQSGVVTADGQVVKGERAGKLLKMAYSRWINDSFWLNPIESIFDPSTQRAVVDTPERGPALLVTYGSGGVTPGDTYLWFIDADGRPTAWKMWVSIIPIGGVELSWDDWTTLSTGAKVSTLHQGLFDLRLTNVQAEQTLSALLDGAPDPFDVLITERGASRGAASAPASGPARGTPQAGTASTALDGSRGSSR